MDNVISLDDLFHKRLFSVPNYQRGYAWGREQIKDFLDDLDILAPGRLHYTGTVVLHRRSDTPEQEDESGNTYAQVDIVDGQQRLTTIVLLLDAIRKSLHIPDGTESPLARGITQNFIAATDVNGMPVYKLTLNSDTNGFFKSNILEAHVADPAANAAQARLREAQAQIWEYLHPHNDKKTPPEQELWLKELLAKVTKRLGFTLFMVDDEAEVGVIFEVMNDRGKLLTDLEKVKNYLLYVASAVGFPNPVTEEVNDAWSHIFGQLMAATLTRPEYEDQLLRVHWLAHYNPAKQDWTGAKSIRDRFDLRKYQAKGQELVEEVLQFTRTLRASVLPYCDALQPQRQGAFGVFPPGQTRHVVAWGTRLRRVGALATFLPLLLAVRARWPEDAEKYLEAVRLSEIFAFRVYRLTGARSDSGESALYRLAHDVARGAETFDGAVTRFKWELHWRCPDKTFDTVTSAQAEQIQSAYGKRYLRYFLYEYETSLAAAKNAAPKVTWDDVQKEDLKDTIEHVLPQTIEGREFWTERFGEHGQAVHLGFVHDLGNLTLTKWNSQFGNRPFHEKKGDLGPDITFCYAKSPFYSEQELAAWSDWGPAEIEERRGRLTRWAKERWGVDFSGIAEPSPEAEPPDEEHEEDSDAADEEVQAAV